MYSATGLEKNKNMKTKELIKLNFVLLRRLISVNSLILIIIGVIIFSLPLCYLLFISGSIKKYQLHFFDLSISELRIALNQILSSATLLGTILYLFFNRKYFFSTWRKMRFMPLSQLPLYLSNMLYSIIGVWLIPILLGLVLIIIGLVYYLTFFQLILILLFSALFIFYITSIYNFILNGSELIINNMNRRLLKYSLSIFLIVSFVLSFYNDLSLFLNDKFMLPWNLLISLIIAVIQNNYTQTIIYSLLVIFFIIISISLGSKLYTYTIKSSSRLLTSRRISRLANIFHVFSNKSVVNNFIPTLIKDLIYNYRSNRTILLSIVFIIAMFFNIERVVDREKLTIILLMVWATILYIVEFNYIFSYDSTSFISFFYFPVLISNVIFGKNILSVLKIFLIQICVLILLSTLIEHYSVSVVGLITLLLINIYILFSITVFTNYFNFKNPLDIRFDSIFSRSTSSPTILLSYLILLILFLPIGISFYCFNINDPIFLVILTVLAMGGLIIYKIGLNRFQQYLYTNRDEIVNNYNS